MRRANQIGGSLDYRNISARSPFDQILVSGADKLSPQEETSHALSSGMTKHSTGFTVEGGTKKIGRHSARQHEDYVNSLLR
jgi:hypothetical protein